MSNVIISFVVVSILFIWLFGWLVVVEFMNSVEKQTIRRLTRHNDSDIKTINDSCEIGDNQRFGNKS